MIYKIRDFIINFLILIGLKKIFYIKKIKIIQHLKKINFDIFFGYYDFSPFNRTESRVIALKVKNNNLKADIVLFDFYKKKNFKKITSTRCWSWQLGSRIKWSSKSDNSFYFNTIYKKNPHTAKYSLDKKKIIFYKNNFYDINYKENIYLSINFFRLNFFREGYGYNYGLDNCNQQAPKNDGIFLNNLNSRKSKLIISLFNIAKFCEQESMKNSFHYVNHISFSPQDNKFIFFHFWKPLNNLKSMCRVFYSDLKGNISIIKNMEKISHYCWVDKNKIIFFCKPVNKKFGFYEIDIKHNKFNYLDFVQKEDGHPTLSHDRRFLYIDSYPDRFNYRSLYKYDLLNKKRFFLGKFYTNHNFINNYKKCDLHPRISNNSNLLSIDTCFNKNREMLILKE
jgi:hypothetical protein